MTFGSGVFFFLKRNLVYLLPPSLFFSSYSLENFASAGKVQPDFAVGERYER